MILNNSDVKIIIDDNVSKRQDKCLDPITNYYKFTNVVQRWTICISLERTCYQVVFEYQLVEFSVSFKYTLVSLYQYDGRTKRLFLCLKFEQSGGLPFRILSEMWFCQNKIIRLVERFIFSFSFVSATTRRVIRSRRDL